MTELREVADSLYGLRPDRFTAARTAAAIQARDDGDRALQAAVKALRRPSVSAWVVNLLVRERAELVEQVISLGDALREAQSLLQGDALRDLGRQRRQLIAAVAAEARSLAESRGQKVTDTVGRQVEETLQAAMTDDAAAEAVRSGLLTQPLGSTGLDALAESLAVPDAGARPAKARRLTVVPDEAPGSAGDSEAEREARRRAAELAAAQEAADLAAGRLRKALRKREKASERRAAAQAELLELEARLEELRRKVAELESQAEDAADTLTQLDDKHERAEAKVQDARAAADEAAARLSALRDD